VASFVAAPVLAPENSGACDDDDDDDDDDDGKAPNGLLASGGPADAAFRKGFSVGCSANVGGA